MAIQYFPECRRGDDYEATFTFTLSAGVLTDCFVWCTVKELTSQTDVQAVMQATSAPGGGITILSGTQIRVSFSKTATAALKAPHRYVADIQFELPDGKVETAEDLDEAFQVRADVTRATAEPP